MAKSGISTIDNGGGGNARFSAYSGSSGAVVGLGATKQEAVDDLKLKLALAKSGAAAASKRLFIGNYPTGIVYADRSRERAGDYLKLASLPYRTLTLEWSKESIPEDLRAAIVRDAKKLQDRRGELYQVSTSGQTVRLGG